MIHRSRYDRRPLASCVALSILAAYRCIGSMLRAESFGRILLGGSGDALRQSGANFAFWECLRSDGRTLPHPWRWCSKDYVCNRRPTAELQHPAAMDQDAARTSSRCTKELRWCGSRQKAVLKSEHCPLLVENWLKNCVKFKLRVRINRNPVALRKIPDGCSMPSPCRVSICVVGRLHRRCIDG